MHQQSNQYQRGWKHRAEISWLEHLLYWMDTMCSSSWTLCRTFTCLHIRAGPGNDLTNRPGLNFQYETFSDDPSTAVADLPADWGRNLSRNVREDKCSWSSGSELTFSSQTVEVADQRRFQYVSDKESVKIREKQMIWWTPKQETRLICFVTWKGINPATMQKRWKCGSDHPSFVAHNSSFTWFLINVMTWRVATFHCLNVTQDTVRQQSYLRLKVLWATEIN